ncbi:MAG: zinc-finger domain-containing protein [Bdellovibrionales bacterium]
MTQNVTAPDPQQPEVIIVDDHADGVSCDGGGGALGHPQVWYAFENDKPTECLYCDRVFIKERDKRRFGL